MHFVHQVGGFNGAHLKIWHYFDHVRQSGRFAPEVWLAPSSRVRPDSPWAEPAARWLPKWAPDTADALFLNALNWQYVPEDCSVPVINLLQNIRHAYPDDDRYRYLRRRAFRISISEEITEAVSATGIANGPMVTIPLGTDMLPNPETPRWTRNERPIDVVIAGLKKPALADQLAATLRVAGHTVTCITQHLPRPEFLAHFLRARVAITLPTHAEGFFLPPIEAIANGCIAICPEVAGTRHYGKNHGVLRPAYDHDSLVEAALCVLLLDQADGSRMLDTGAAFVREHSLDKERQLFCRALDDFDTFASET